MDSSESEVLKIAVISDLHFIDKASIVGDASKASWLVFSDGKFEGSFWDSLLERIEKEKLEADVLVCPGDITTFADPSGLKFAWKKIHELGTKLGVKEIAVATGNHDVQTRPTSQTNVVRDLNKFNDVFGNLKALDPPYPLIVTSELSSEQAHNNRVHYFGADYLIYDNNDDYKLVIFNSCAKHTQSPSDYERGSISPTTLAWLEKSIKQNYSAKCKKVGVFICHHHPILHEDKRLGSYDFMLNGTELIEMLNKYGNWIVIHGHKHHAKLSLNGAGSKKVAVFSAGTLSSHKDTLGEGFNNQFYIIEVDRKFFRNGLRGSVKAWSWKGNQWSLSKSVKDGVYTGVGFCGYIVLDEIVEEIKKLFSASDISKKWEFLLNQIEDLKYMTPKDIEHLGTYLLEQDLEFSYNDDGEIDAVNKLFNAGA